MLKLSNNTALPEASAYGVKSFWLLLITVLITACNAFGFDLAASLCEVGLGCTADDIGAKAERAINLTQQLLPIITAIWLWIERRAPNFRLVFWRGKSTNTVASWAWAVLIFAMMSVGATSHAWALAATCASPRVVDAALRDQFGEACAVVSGTGWQAHQVIAPDAAEGEPA